MNGMRKTARTAGLLYLIFIVIAIFAGVLRSTLVSYDNAGATAKRIAASPWLFRIDFLSDLASSVFFLLAAWALYVLLKSVDKHIALLFLLLNVCGVSISSMNMLNQFAALLLLSDYSKVFPPDQLQALAMFFLAMHKSGFVLMQVLFGAWLFPLGYLVLKSGFLPRILGVLLIMDGIGEMIWVVQFFLFPGHDVITYPGFVVSFVAELALSLWLLIKGVKDQEPASIQPVTS